jgi:hypothetical protein
MFRFGWLAVLACIGCAHNQYAYAPPLAPPVYPQPQPVTQPVVYPAPPGAAPVAPGPMPAVGAATPAVECCPPLGEGGAVAMPVVYESGQTPPCPPGP